MKGQFRPEAPVVPRQVGTLSGIAEDELRRTGETLQKTDVLNGKMTDTIELGIMSTTQRIAHGLNRTPIGFFVAHYLGFWPRFRVLSVDSKYIKIFSLEEARLSDRFVLDATPVVTTQPVNTLVTAARTGVGVYQLTLGFTAATVLDCRADSNSGASSYAIRYTTSSAGPPVTVDITNYTLGGAATDLSSAIVFFGLSVSGCKPKFKLWVY